MNDTTPNRDSIVPPPVPPVIPPQVRPDDDVLFAGDQVMVTPGLVNFGGRSFAVRNIVSARLVERRQGPNYGPKMWMILAALFLFPVGAVCLMMEDGIRIGLVLIGLSVAAGIWAWKAPVSGARFSWELRMEMSDRQEVVGVIENQLEAEAGLVAVLTAMNRK